MGKQGGFALATAMMVLALLSVLGAMAIQSTTLEVQISAHDRDARAALYVAEAALDEARYYVARGWGKIFHTASIIPDPLTVDLDTPPPPFVPWDDNLYVGFTLVDATGEDFRITGNTTGTLTLDTAGGTKAPPQPSDRFLVVRNIPAVGTVGPPTTVTWTAGPPPVLTVDNLTWSTATFNAGASWTGWLLWDSTGTVYSVAASNVSGSAVELELGDNTAPAGPFVLGVNPWLAELEGGGTPLPGDTDTSTADTWDRVFYDAGGNVLGRSGVQATRIAGTLTDYTLTSDGRADVGQQTVRLSVFEAGSRMQTFGDWSIDYE